MNNNGSSSESTVEVKDVEKQSNRVSLIQLFLLYIHEKKYGKALLTIVAGVCGGTFFVLLITGLLQFISSKSFSINSLITALVALIFYFILIYTVGNVVKK